MSILGSNYNYLMTKKCLNNIPYRKLSLHCKQHSKTRKEHVLIKYVYLIRFCYIFLLQRYHRALLHTRRSEAAVDRDVLQNRCSWKFRKIYEKTPLLESPLNKVTGLKRLHHKCFLWFLQNFQEHLMIRHLIQ